MPQQGTGPARSPAATQAQARTTTLERAATARRVDALFRAMSGDFLLREQFVTDPVQVLWEYVHGSPLPTEQAAYANQLIYGAFANPQFRQWLWSYAVHARGAAQPIRAFRANLARAAVGTGAHHLVQALIRSSAESGGSEGYQAFEWAMQALFPAFNLPPSGQAPVINQTEDGTDGGTAIDGTDSGTIDGTDSGTFETFTDGTGTSVTGITFTGTGTDTGTLTGTDTGTSTDTGTLTGTDIFTFTGSTELTHGTLTFTSSTLTLTGQTFQTQILTSTDTGTFTSLTFTTQTVPATSTGTSTFFTGPTFTSTATGTTPFTLTGITRGPFTGTDTHTAVIFSGAYIQVSLESLFQYAMQLAASGALDASGDE
jgi:hypothetical protein